MNNLPKYPVGTILQRINNNTLTCTVDKVNPVTIKDGHGMAYVLEWSSGIYNTWTEVGMGNQLKVIRMAPTIQFDEELFTI